MGNKNRRLHKETKLLFQNNTVINHNLKILVLIIVIYFCLSSILSTFPSLTLSLSSSLSSSLPHSLSDSLLPILAKSKKMERISQQRTFLVNKFLNESLLLVVTKSWSLSRDFQRVTFIGNLWKSRLVQLTHLMESLRQRQIPAVSQPRCD